ncbi:MAG: hypothetical protein CL489_10485 [Acidobacteria bacterium]|nr:hypothetical protein [Acidobacteriota bacterium]
MSAKELFLNEVNDFIEEYGFCFARYLDDKKILQIFLTGFCPGSTYGKIIKITSASLDGERISLIGNKVTANTYWKHFMYSDCSRDWFERTYKEIEEDRERFPHQPFELETKKKFFSRETYQRVKKKDYVDIFEVKDTKICLTSSDWIGEYWQKYYISHEEYINSLKKKGGLTLSESKDDGRLTLMKSGTLEMV